MTCITQVIDGGTPYESFKGYIKSYSSFVSHIKFGWGSAIIDPEIKNKIYLLNQFDISFNPGGTLFEYFYFKDKLDEYEDFIDRHGFQWIELSRGTISICDDEYKSLIKHFSKKYKLFSEVGFKSVEKSDNMCPSDWLESCRLSLEAGADIIVIEARETGTAGIVDKDGNIKMETIDLLISEIGKEKLLFEAPTKDIQSFLINKYGSSINLGNISIQNILPLQALRQNLRSDTLTFQSIDK